MSKKIQHNTSSFVEQIKHLIKDAQKGLARSVDSIMVQTYYEIGKSIVVEEQQGSERAEYGKYIISELSKKLTEEFGKGYSKRNLERT
jgi:type III secretory pathway lipoprotein EscJ